MNWESYFFKMSPYFSQDIGRKKSESFIESDSCLLLKQVGISSNAASSV